MSLNKAHTPDGRGVLIYNGEMILLYIKEVNLTLDEKFHSDFKGKKHGNLYLTSHRIIFINNGSGGLRSLSIPFHSLRNVKLEQPIFGANYLNGAAVAEPDGGWSGEANWKLTFNKGGCIDFGQALLKANDMANNFRPHNAPPQYAPPAGAYYAPPPEYYMAQGGNYNGFQAPVHTVFMYEQPPPYPGIGPNQPPRPMNQNEAIYPSLNNPSAPNPNASAPYPAAPPSYDTATALPQKS
ncbi:WW domain-binding protein 2 [Ditylenchus destructor]|uniref:WW domain-binding protein 2 n=1 Tax=Ditylenchus destructor TaxID=166010 RepID=A0AAD4NEN5_9BILA|nr:WW domain-binding protein 2 [Ditylenchus destructor]